MPICPYCKKEIDHLREESMEIVPYNLKLINGKLDWEPTGDEADCVGDNKYFCPECDNRIATALPDAEAFLRK